LKPKRRSVKKTEDWFWSPTPILFRLPLDRRSLRVLEGDTRHEKFGGRLARRVKAAAKPADISWLCKPRC
jgi:hypothetical protein